MTPRHTTSVFISAILMIVAAVALTMILSTGQIQAQPRATLAARSQAIQQTAQAAQAQVQSVRQTAQAAQQNVQAGSTRLVATAEAVRATVEAVQTKSIDLATSVAATAQYLATTINQQAADVQATATAISATIRARLNALPPEVADLIGYLVDQASVDYDPATGTLTVTSYVSELQANDLLDVLVQAAGYNPDAVSIDTRADGTVQVILVDATRELSGTAVLTYEIAIEDGRASAVLIGVTLNGAEVPLTMIPDDFGSAARLAIAGAAQQIFVNLGQSSANYATESVIVSEEGFLVTYRVFLK